MAIKVSQAFERTSAQPIDTSLALTKAEMLAVNDNLMPAYYFTICQDDGKVYLYDKSATPSTATGKFTEFSGGGGGDSAGHIILDNDGTAMAKEPNLQFKGLNVTDNSTDEITEVESVGLNQDSMDDVLNASIPGNQVASNGLVYSTEEQVVGKWVDGKPLYQKTYQLTFPSGAVISNDYDLTNILSMNIDVITEMKGTAVRPGSTVYTMPLGCGYGKYGSGGGVLWVGRRKTSNVDTLYAGSGDSAWLPATLYLTIQYTKTTD